MPNVGDLIIVDGKQHIVLSVSPTNPNHYASCEYRPNVIEPEYTTKEYEILKKIAVKLGVTI